MKNSTYDSDVTDAQWEFLYPMLDKPNKYGRPQTDRRLVVNAILYVLKGGIQWRQMPSDFPPWKTVYHVFRAWTLDHTWASLNDALRACVRGDEGRTEQPTAAILDCQSVKSDGHGGEVGYDAGKRIKGRKRHILVDSLGLLLGAIVSPADCPDREGAKQLLDRVADWFPRLEKIWADGGYAGEAFEEWVKAHWSKIQIEIVKRSDQVAGFVVMPRRWIVERTFAWLMSHRRLVRDYERTETSAVAWIHLAMIRLQLRRLA